VRSGSIVTALSFGRTMAPSAATTASGGSTARTRWKESMREGETRNPVGGVLHVRRTRY
jgi:hypothetical protein